MRLAYVLSMAVLCAIATMAPPAAAQNATADAIEAVTAHFRSTAARYAASSADLRDLAVTDAYTDARTGTSYVYLRQRIHGIEVFNGTAGAAVNRNGLIYGENARFISDLASRTVDARPDLTATEAIRSAARQLEVDNVGALVLERELPNVAGGAVYSAPTEAALPITARLVYFATEAGPVRLAWDILLEESTGRTQVHDGVMVDGESHLWSARVDARSGVVLDVVDLVAHDTWGESTQHAGQPIDLAPVSTARAAVPSSVISGSYRILPIPTESPTHGPFVLTATPHNPVASPTGWHVAGPTSYTVTRGNNVHAYEDQAASNLPGMNPDGGAGLLFDFPFDPGAAPVGNLNAAITNLFYWNNIVHDVMWHHGFTDVAGNFQQVNAGGGFGSDYVQAEALDGSGTNNANFSTPPDGARPRMQMYEWTAGATLEVTAPPAAAGTYANQPAAFGPPAPSPPLDEDIVLVDDGFGGNLGCTAPSNGPDIAGNIALIERGDCEFGVKVLNAINAGAVGAIVFNCSPNPPACNATTGEELVTMGPGVTPPDQLTIPATFVARSTGVIMRNNQTGLHGLFGGSGQNRDSDFDNGIIVHEYGHGISNRLVGGPATTSCLGNQEQMGEGWSDYFGVIMTMRPGDVASQPRGVGTYAVFQPTNGPGIRPAPYSTDFGVNNFTYQNVITQGGGGLSIPHGIGFVWATMVWEMTWELIADLGWSPDIYNAAGPAGNQVSLRLVTEGLKLTACNPGFVDGRNAILEADTALYGGANSDNIWIAFARRGLGYSASQGSTSSVNDGVAAFDLPPGVANEPGAPEVGAVVLPPQPNPATGQAVLAITLQEAEEVRVQVFDALGRLVATTREGEMAAAVRHEVTIDTRGLAPGVYVWRVAGERFIETGRLTVVR
jgi:hypothetical protein